MEAVELNERLRDLAQQLVYAQGVKGSAKIRIQCELPEWNAVVAEARRIYAQRRPTK